jgi:hypothetical protein
MKVRLRVLDHGTRGSHSPSPRRRARHLDRPRPGGRLRPDRPAYDLNHERTGRPRVLRRSRLRLVRATAPTREVAR